jgi:zinc/manganese transport system substrate-binding protein
MKWAALSLALWPWICHADPAPIRCVASFSILGDMVREIGGDHVALTVLVGPDGDAHVYQPTPNDARAVAEARVFVINGLGLEGWLDRLTRAASFSGTLVTASNGIMPLVTGGSTDPHAWQDVADAEIYVRNIEAALAAADPANADDYRARLNRYEAALTTLDTWIRDQIATIPEAHRRIITTHDAFGYFGRAYGVHVEAPVGMDEESEPSAATLAQLIRQVREDGTKAIFIENMTDPRLINQLASETGATLGGTLFADALSKRGDGGESYIAMMRHNVTLMVAAMGR